MVKAVIFDFDGTITNRPKNTYDLFDKELKCFVPNMSDIEYEAFIQDFLTFDCYGTIPLESRIDLLKHKYELPEDFKEVWKKIYYEAMPKYIVLKDDTIDVLKALQGKYKLAIISNGGSSSQHSKIEAANIKQYFDCVIVSDDIGYRKPDKRLFDYVAEKLNVKNEECVFIGDVFSSDILGAINANMTPVWFCADSERPASHYKGYRIDKLSKVLDILKQLEN